MTDARDERLEAIRTAITACRICRDMPERGPEHRLPHEPRPVAVISSKARILIAGQAPGLRVHESGLPFDDASGNRLRDWLGVTRDQFYDRDLFAIVPMGFCFPGYDAHGSDLPPRRECAPHWRQPVIDAMPQIELVLAIGQYAQAWHLRERKLSSMTETVRNWRSYLGSNTGPAVLALPHPSWRNTGWLKKNPWFEADVLPVLQDRVKKLMK
ncbi:MULTISPECIES: uracil-DNA glycosylase family protein [unclassified Rhizobium]|uniref:uracil-DNA glycosylase family protein n=1 Tax=unclassified Rhizobium TaxID=2613769 RepID=UPI000715EC6D|nr:MULTISPECIES: uracil-DNA glycosylase family protein [unclassified Rhizobium]KQS98105.1 uracil-DNA glycosylase [Rhizobium sp. Leaf386]KQT00367.1 uracil-DNA glycosylase [Rhizobium sp. Leaf391]KQT97370.1 uracil-DNA glycosylase [Rhizobium sp. Leaf453]